MLPTKDKSHIQLRPNKSGTTTLINYKHSLGCFNRINQHLYFTSDEEIKKGDNIYNIVQKTVFIADEQFMKLIGNSLPTNTKIVATTDKSLTTIDYTKSLDQEIIYLPQIPQQFIEDYYEAGGIDEVKVRCGEYCENCGQEYCDNLQCRGYADTFIYNIDDNNCIVIIPNKPKFYTKKEVLSLLEKALIEYSDYVVADIPDWIKENLK